MARSRRRTWLLLAPLIFLAACAAPEPPPPEPAWRESPEAAGGAASVAHLAGQPHTDRLGQPRRQLDPGRSFFPLALDNAMVDYGRGLRFGFAHAYEAGFNAVAPWAGQPPAAVLNAAAGSRVLAILEGDARDQAAEEQADSQALLDAGAVRLARIEPFRTAPAANDAAVIDGPQGLDILRQAVAQTPNTPIWAVLQAYAAPNLDRRLPSSAEARALAYGAVINGASGLVWFGEDSYAARSNGALGIGPALPLDYGVQVTEGANQPFKPEPAQVGQARALWLTISRLNREIERLTPALLSPTAPGPLRAELLPLDGGPDLAPGETPIRLRLKHQPGSQPGHLTLLAVNSSLRPWRLRLELPIGISRLERWFDTDPPPALKLGNRQFEEDFPPLGVRIYRITP